MASADALLFIDDDVILPEGFIAAHFGRLYSSAAIGAVTGPVVDRMGEKVAYEKFRRMFDLEHFGQFDCASASWFIGCNFSVKREVLDETGPFDQTFTGSAYYEDIDMALRVRETGYVIAFDRDAWLVHMAVSSGGCETRNREGAEERAREQFGHQIYCRLKHARIQGRALTAKLIYRILRSYVLNRYGIGRLFPAAAEIAAALRRLVQYHRIA